MSTDKVLVGDKAIDRDLAEYIVERLRMVERGLGEAEPKNNPKAELQYLRRLAENPITVNWEAGPISLSAKFTAGHLLKGYGKHLRDVNVGALIKEYIIGEGDDIKVSRKPLQPLTKLAQPELKSTYGDAELSHWDRLHKANGGVAGGVSL